MTRVKRGPRGTQRRNKILTQTKGYRLSRSKLLRRAKEAAMRATEHQFAGRKRRKRDIRKLWIIRISAALTPFDINYSRFIKGLKDSNIELNRKMLSEIAIHDTEAFKQIVEAVKEKSSKK